MCLILFAYNHHPKYRLILAANRDEFYERPTAPMMYWQDHPHILAGRDLKSMGTWMGITRSGRFAAVTNYREPGRQILDAPSRGRLVSDYLNGTMGPDDYLKRLKQEGHRYNGFNLLVGDTEALYYFSNRSENDTRLESGIHGLSNRLLDTPWPKVVQSTNRLAALIDQDDDPSPDGILELLQTRAVPPDSQIPDTGMGIEWERILAPIFITSPTYGTRCSTLLTISRSNKVRITEITWQPAQPAPTQQGKANFDFTLGGLERIERDD